MHLLHRPVHRGMLRRGMSQRIYTKRDSEVERALETARRAGLVSAGASGSERLRALALYADARLTEEADLQERIRAYDELAEDRERSEVIRASVLAGVEAGIL